MNRYRIEGVLGAGGFAMTYLGVHTGLNQKVAIKEYLADQHGFREDDGTTVRPKTGAKQAFKHGLKRFADEARTLAKFKHPVIVPVTDIFEANGTAYMVMEYVEGESLQERLVTKGSLKEPTFRAIFNPILTALEEIHATGILHRDIKPANINVRNDDTPVLLDFGNSRAALGANSRSLTVALTPGYAPAEQYSSRGKQGPWTDIYSLGATMYVAITGIDPPEAPDRALDDDYVPAGDVAKGIRKKYPPGLLAAIDKALAVHPDDRPQDIAEFRALLESEADAEAEAEQEDALAGPRTILPGKQAARQTTGGGARPAKRPKAPMGSGRPMWQRIAVAVVVLAVLGGGGAFGWVKYQEAETRRMAVEAKKAKLAAAEQARLAAEKARIEAKQRSEVERWERAAVTAQHIAEEEERWAAYLRWKKKNEQSAKPVKTKKRPRCADVGGYEAYMKRTGKVCML